MEAPIAEFCETWLRSPRHHRLFADRLEIALRNGRPRTIQLRDIEPEYLSVRTLSLEGITSILMTVASGVALILYAHWPPDLGDQIVCAMTTFTIALAIASLITARFGRLVLFRGKQPLRWFARKSAEAELLTFAKAISRAAMMHRP